MFIQDKASGEIGRAIKHPLQSEFEKSLYRVLGEQRDWCIGDQIEMNEFNNVSNKGFVRNRLEALGFVLGRTVNTYVCTVGKDKSRRSIQVRKKIKSERPNVPVTLFEPDKQYSRHEVRKLLNKGLHLSTESLNAKQKSAISNIIFKLRKREELPILSKIFWEESVLKTIYWLDK